MVESTPKRYFIQNMRLLTSYIVEDSLLLLAIIRVIRGIWSALMAIKRLNNRPRKRLGFNLSGQETPNQVFFEEELTVALANCIQELRYLSIDEINEICRLYTSYSK